MAITDLLFGRTLASDEEGEQRVGVLAAIPMLGLDALGSAAYGPEAAEGSFQRLSPRRCHQCSLVSCLGKSSWSCC